MPIDTNQIAGIIEPSLDAMGYRLVRVAVLGAGRTTLQIMAERRDDASMTVDDCADISRSVSALLDVADPIASAYTLEVSSPGIDRPLVRPEDYDRFAGFEARIEVSRPISGRKRFRGRLLGRSGDTVRLIAEAGEVEVPLSAIARAKLVLTDDLLALAQGKIGPAVGDHLDDGHGIFPTRIDHVRSAERSRRGNLFITLHHRDHFHPGKLGHVYEHQPDRSGADHHHIGIAAGRKGSREGEGGHSHDSNVVVCRCSLSACALSRGSRQRSSGLRLELKHAGPRRTLRTQSGPP